MKKRNIYVICKRCGKKIKKVDAIYLTMSENLIDIETPYQMPFCQDCAKEITGYRI